MNVELYCIKDQEIHFQWLLKYKLNQYALAMDSPVHFRQWPMEQLEDTG